MSYLSSILKLTVTNHEQYHRHHCRPRAGPGRLGSGTFIELIQPVSGQSIFHDYLAKYPAGGVQHLAFQLPVSNFGQLTSDLRTQGCKVIGELDHPIARMAFFDTYETLGVATEIMGITPEGWAAVEQMKLRR